MKTASNATKRFRATFKKVRRELSKASGFGFSMSDSKKILAARFREAMIAAEVPATRQRLELVHNWINRATMMCGGAA